MLTSPSRLSLRFDERREAEPALKLKGKKRSFRDNFGDASSEKVRRSLRPISTLTSYPPLFLSSHPYCVIFINIIIIVIIVLTPHNS